MPTLQIDFQEEINTSAQVGDKVYYITPNTNGEFDFADINNIIDVGYPISSVSTGLPAFITVDYPSNTTTLNSPPQGSFIMFAKDNRVNMSSLIGYYARAKFINNSKKRAEMFVVCSEIKESSQ
jgi:hypothetical protein